MRWSPMDRKAQAAAQARTLANMARPSRFRIVSSTRRRVRVTPVAYDYAGVRDDRDGDVSWTSDWESAPLQMVIIGFSKTYVNAAARAQYRYLRGITKGMK